MGLVWQLVETRTDSRTRSVDVLEISQALPASSGPAGHIAPVHIPQSLDSPSYKSSSRRPLINRCAKYGKLYRLSMHQRDYLGLSTFLKLASLCCTYCSPSFPPACW